MKKMVNFKDSVIRIWKSYQNSPMFSYTLMNEKSLRIMEKT